MHFTVDALKRFGDALDSFNQIIYHNVIFVDTRGIAKQTDNGGGRTFRIVRVQPHIVEVLNQTCDPFFVRVGL